MADTSADNLHSVRLKVDLSDLPQEVDLSPSRIGAFFGMVFGVVCGLASRFFGPLPGARDSDFQAFLLIFPAIGAAIFLGSLVSLFRKRRATFRSDGVEVEGRGFWAANPGIRPTAASGASCTAGR